MMKRMLTVLLIAMLLSGFGMAGASAPQAAEKNQAVVTIDGETIVMRAVSMEVGVHGFAPGYKVGDQYHYAPAMEILKFEQVDARTGDILKTLHIFLPRNWQAGMRYTTDDAYDRVYGMVGLYLQDHQTGKAPYTDLLSLIAKSSMQLIIDEANADYSMIKGRFVANANYGTTHVEFALSSFYVDKNSLASAGATDVLDPFAIAEPSISPIAPAPGGE